MEVVQELLVAPKFKKKKKPKEATNSAKIIVDRVTRDQVRPGTGQQHGPKLRRKLLYGFDAPFPNLSISLDLRSPREIFFAARVLPSES